MEGKILNTNREAEYKYFLTERFEAGLVLTGTEVKAVRNGRANLKDSYATVRNGEVWLLNAHISPYPQGNIYNHEPNRPRKLLLHTREIGELAGTTTQKGLTLIPLRVYIKGHVAKVQIGLARGRKLYDKRQAIIEKEQEREIGRAVRSASRG